MYHIAASSAVQCSKKKNAVGKAPTSNNFGYHCIRPRIEQMHLKSAFAPQEFAVKSLL
jgi:hypothetical protein